MKKRGDRKIKKFSNKLAERRSKGRPPCETAYQNDEGSEETNEKSSRADGFSSDQHAAYYRVGGCRIKE